MGFLTNFWRPNVSPFRRSGLGWLGSRFLPDKNEPKQRGKHADEVTCEAKPCGNQAQLPPARNICCGKAILNPVTLEVSTAGVMRKRSEAPLRLNGETGGVFLRPEAVVCRTESP